MNEKIYIAGPYTDEDDEVVEDNVLKAITVADQISKLGFRPFIPHLFHYWDKEFEHGYEFWMEQGSSWLSVCDGLLRIPGESTGSNREVHQASQEDIPTFSSILQLIFHFDTDLKDKL